MELTPNAPISLLTKRAYDKAFEKSMELASTGYDIIKKEYKKRGVKKTVSEKVSKVGPIQAGHGWYIQGMAGLQRKFPKGWNALRTTAQQQSSSYQTSDPHKLTISQISDASILAGITKTDVDGITTKGINSYLTTARYKVMFTNLSNISQQYEFFYVVAKRDTDRFFSEDVDKYSIDIDAGTGTGLLPTMFQWDPSKIPALMDRWRILSKSVFRLETGATGEINIKDQIYKKVTRNDMPLETPPVNTVLYQAGLYTELWVRWWGAPVGITEPSPINITKITFGDTNVTTGFVMERCINWFQADINQPHIWYYETNVPTGPTGTQIIVTHEATDEAITAVD